MEPSVQDAELIQFVQDFREGFLGHRSSDFHCAMICEPLAGLLNHDGVACRTRMTDHVRTSFGSIDHVWIELADGRVLDPTADQFNDMGLNMPKVYLGAKVRKLHRASRHY